MRKASEETTETVEGWTHTLRFGTLNIKTITGRGRKLADIMEQRNVDTVFVPTVNKVESD